MLLLGALPAVIHMYMLSQVTWTVGSFHSIPSVAEGKFRELIVL